MRSVKVPPWIRLLGQWSRDREQKRYASEAELKNGRWWWRWIEDAMMESHAGIEDKTARQSCVESSRAIWRDYQPSAIEHEISLRLDANYRHKNPWPRLRQDTRADLLYQANKGKVVDMPAVVFGTDDGEPLPIYGEQGELPNCVTLPPVTINLNCSDADIRKALESHIESQRRQKKVPNPTRGMRHRPGLADYTLLKKHGLEIPEAIGSKAGKISKWLIVEQLDKERFEIGDMGNDDPFRGRKAKERKKRSL